MAGRTRERTFDGSLSQLSRLMMVAIGLGLLSMPVTFRGGSDEAHPHSVFQIFQAGGEAALHHHSDREDDLGPDGAHRDPVTGASLPSDGGDAPVVEATSSAAERVGGAAIWSPSFTWIRFTTEDDLAPSRAAPRLTGRSDVPPLPPPRMVHAAN